MAIVNSLVCWGGSTGKIVTISNASPAVVSLTTHGAPDGLGLVFSTTGVLPAGIVAGTTYYAKSTASDTFNLYDTAAHAIAGGATGRINTSSAGSGVHTGKSDLIVNPAARLAAHGLTDLTRWGSRIYDGIASWNAGRSGASADDEEVCELGEAFTETIPYSGNVGDYNTRVSVPAAKSTIVAEINGLRTSAFHYGFLYAGYQLKNGYGPVASALYDTQYDGFTILGGDTQGLILSKQGQTAANLIVLGASRSSQGVYVQASGVTVENCVIAGWAQGMYFNAYVNYTRIFNNLTTKNTTGMLVWSGSESTTTLFCYNNISVGNDTTDWGAPPLFDGCSGNAGPGTTAWKSTAGFRLTIATSDLKVWGTTTIAATDRYWPNVSTSPQVDTAASARGVPTSDIADAFKPSYKNGAATYPDSGPYEFDHGYGPWPVTATLTMTGLVSGSDVVVLVAGTSTVLTSVDANAGSSWAYTYTTAQNVDIGIIKPGYKVKYIRNYPLAASDVSIPVEQQPDLSYA